MGSLEGRHGSGAVAESSHLSLQTRSTEISFDYNEKLESFETPKSASSDLLPPGRPHFLILPHPKKATNWRPETYGGHLIQTTTGMLT